MILLCIYLQISDAIVHNDIVLLLGELVQNQRQTHYKFMTGGDVLLFMFLMYICMPMISVVCRYVQTILPTYWHFKDIGSMPMQGKHDVSPSLSHLHKLQVSIPLLLFYWKLLFFFTNLGYSWFNPLSSYLHKLQFSNIKNYVLFPC